MDIAKVTSKGQITIPQEVREKMELRTGDKVVFFEEDGRYWLQNSMAVVLTDFQKALKGKAKKAGFGNPADVIGYIKGLRRASKN